MRIQKQKSRLRSNGDGKDLYKFTLIIRGTSPHIRVQIVMAAFAQGLAEKFFVDFLDGRILVGFTQFLTLIFRVDSVDAFPAYLVVGEAGLSASTDTSAGTGHYFYEMVFGLSGDHPFDDL